MMREILIVFEKWRDNILLSEKTVDQPDGNGGFL
jgi:hypothetical protein